MSSIILAIIFVIAILFFCWLLAEYWLRDYRRRPEDDKRLRFGTRTAFALTHFWKRVDDAKNLKQESVKEDLAGIGREFTKERTDPLQMQNERIKERGAINSGKKFRIKENM